MPSTITKPESDPDSLDNYFTADIPHRHPGRLLLVLMAVGFIGLVWLVFATDPGDPGFAGKIAQFRLNLTFSLRHGLDRLEGTLLRIPRYQLFVLLNVVAVGLASLMFRRPSGS